MRRILAFLVIVAACAGGTFWYLSREPATATPTAAQQRPAPAVAVLFAVAQQQDVQLYMTGLGTVQAFNTVTVKARVDGQIDKIGFVEGQDVKAGDLLAQIDPRPFQAALQQAIAQKARDEAQLINAKLELTRATSLATREFATQQRVDASQAQVATLIAAIQGDQAMIDNARTQLGYTTITAPISGRTGVRLIDQGNIVHSGDASGIVVITQLQPISVVFTLPQDTFDEIQAEQAKGQLHVVAFKRDEKTRIEEGTLALVDNQMDQATGTIRLKATFANANNALWPGAFVSARLMLGPRRGVTVPSPAVQRGPQGTYAYVVKADETVELRPITVHQIRDGVALIDDGIGANERVVTDGHYKLKPGIRVDAKPQDDKGQPKTGA
ncbi:MAG: efflux RND transporter periplasmic adaptor subunit [Alphaproteobacteria bacterium]|nr:efflux RND transporter periplasmic adaptor subunit [Alphaproteobacteria bacterium]